MQGGLHGGGGAEVDVGHQRHVDAHRQQAALDLAEGAGIRGRGRGDAHDFAAHFDQAQGLGQRGLDVLVRVVVIDWTRIGLSPPTPTLPTITSRVGRLL